MPDIRLPRGVVPLAAEGISLELAVDVPSMTWIESDEALARAALTRAWPLIEKAVLRDAAKRILMLARLSTGRVCPVCHKDAVSGPDRPNPAFRSRRETCASGHEWDVPLVVENPVTERSLLRRLARGEPLPDIPAKETPGA